MFKSTNKYTFYSHLDNINLTLIIAQCAYFI
jgi:hypothetical protein